MATQPKSTRMLSVIQVANLLGCTRPHVYNLIAAGELRPVDIALGTRTKTRIRESDLEAWIERKARGSKATA